ncbi:hypothetical protein MRB53_021161 [Persea americana]|uniref:Uncharacterized protein n=1 Tax=Persea americana TaxID=3435 RepID=A0ACC2L482_PERAE|nr:hypothetical protein MRB53_021161 [Persea americana]
MQEGSSEAIKLLPVHELHGPTPLNAVPIDDQLHSESTTDPLGPTSTTHIPGNESSIQAKNISNQLVPTTQPALVWNDGLPGSLAIDLPITEVQHESQPNEKNEQISGHTSQPQKHPMLTR